MSEPRNSRLDQWRQREKLTYAALGRRIGVKSPNTARRYCLPPDDPEHRLPTPVVMVRIFVESGGFATPNDFYDLPPLAEQAAA